MKKNIINTLITLSICFLTSSINAQDGYNYTLIDNGSYSFTIAAVPNASASNFSTSVQSYGFTIILSDGITASITSSIGGGADDTFFDGNNVAQPTIDGYLITETLGSPVALPAPSAGTTTPMVTIQVNGSPASGTISVLANDSPLATTVTPLKSFMSADMIDDTMAIFPNVVDPNTSALSGTSSYNFSTLSVEEDELISNEISLFPNPAKDIVKIIVSENTPNFKIEVFDTLGKQILLNLSEENTIDVSNLNSGLYLVSIIIDEVKITKRLIVD